MLIQLSLIILPRVLIEKIPLARIERVTSVSKKWLQDCVNALYSRVPQQLEVTSKLLGLTIECDEACHSSVNCKGHKQWTWLPLDVNMRELVGTYLGNSSREPALKVWHSSPPVYR